MARLAALLRQRHEDILNLWREEANRAASARGLSKPEFDNMLPRFLSAIADADLDALGKVTGDRRKLIENHLASRLRQGFDLAEIVEELAILGRVVARQGEAVSPEARPTTEEIDLLFAELNAAATLIADMFREHMRKDEQGEKRYMRLLQQIASSALESGAHPLRKRLREVIELIMEAMDAQSAALLLFDLQSGKLITAASAGDAGDALEQHAMTLDPLSFASHVATHEETPAAVDAITMELKVSDTLRRGGIHSLLAVPFPPRRRLMGVLYIGLIEERPFSPRELGRLGALGSALTVHLDNAKLFADLQATIESLKLERDLRETFVSVLAHDLRGPLASAKMNAQILARHPEKLDDRRELAAKISRNIDRTDRMIRDLLDVSRVRAGERLPLRLKDCDLGVVAREVVEELSAIHGDHFVLEDEHDVRGIWSAEELHRALWNLATNALKYGALDRPITIVVKRSPGWAEASVHNHGSVIAKEEQLGLFQPFVRTREAQSGTRRGWGLGLTLVRACAESHGGNVEIQSDAVSGTKFTLSLPLDARPYQTHIESLTDEKTERTFPPIH
jgi:signal transduction histidine kinase